MSAAEISMTDQIQKIQSFIIVITTTTPKNKGQSQQSKYCNILDVANGDGQSEKKDQQITKVQRRKTRNSQEVLEIVDKTLRKIKCQSKILQNLQKYTQNKAKYQKLLRNSPKKVRHSSSDCRKKKLLSPPNKITFLNYNQVNGLKQAAPSSQRKLQTQYQNLALFPVLRVNPYILSIYNTDRFESFYLMKTIKEQPTYNKYLAMQFVNQLRNLNNRMIYTLKIVRRAEINRKLLGKFARQLKIQAYLAHANIYKLYHVNSDSRFVYILSQPNLGQDIIQKQKECGGLMSEKQVRDILKQICKAVEYMHKNDVIHRNIKPENIFIHESTIKIDNFQEAIYSPLLRKGKPFKQQNSMEAIKIELCDSKIDIWNIGILTYQLLFGKTPFKIQDLSDKKVDHSLYFSEYVDVSDGAKQFISGCLQKNQMKRFSIRQAIDHGFLRGGDKYRWTTM